MNFSVEEENLICMYHTSDCRRTMARMLAALPDMDTKCFGWQTAPLQNWSKWPMLTLTDRDSILRGSDTARLMMTHYFQSK